MDADERTIKVDAVSRVTVKIDENEMTAEARRSVGVLGPPVSVTLESDEAPQGNPIRAAAVIGALVLAFAVGAFLARSGSRPVPVLPPPMKPVIAHVTLRVVELPSPEQPPRLLHKRKTPKRSDTLVDPWAAKPLFNKSAYERF